MHMIRYFIPRLRDILFIAILVAALALGQRMLNMDGDLGHHLAMGRNILESKEIPTQDMFSFTRKGEPRPPYEWLTQIFFALAEKVGGLDGIIFISALLLASSFTIVLADSVRRSQLPLTALMITSLAVAASSLHWLPRPHLVTFLFLAIWMERLERVRSGRSIPLWQFPLLMLIWVNSHGGFLFGILGWMAYMAAGILDKIRTRADDGLCRKYLLIGALSIATTFITPSLWGNWTAVLDNSNRYVLSRTVETMPPDFTQPGILPFGLLLLITFIIIMTTRKTIPISHIFLLVGFGILGITFVRNIPIFAIVAAPILTQASRAMFSPAKRWSIIESNILSLESRLLGITYPILTVTAMAILLVTHFQSDKSNVIHYNENIYPVAAANWLEGHLQEGNGFNDFNWGGYLLYRLWPRQKVFIDSQTDFYGEELVKEYEQVITARKNWQSIIEKYGVEWAILPVSSPLSTALRDSGWKPLYEDGTAVIFRTP